MDLSACEGGFARAFFYEALDAYFGVLSSEGGVGLGGFYSQSFVHRQVEALIGGPFDVAKRGWAFGIGFG